MVPTPTLLIIRFVYRLPLISTFQSASPQFPAQNPGLPTTTSELRMIGFRKFWIVASPVRLPGGARSKQRPTQLENRLYC
jgi:hypothetical protein